MTDIDTMDDAESENAKATIDLAESSKPKANRKRKAADDVDFHPTQTEPALNVDSSTRANGPEA